MKITGCKYASFTLKFKRPFIVSKTSLSERKIIFVKIYNEDGFFSCGEAAPLPQFGSETFEEAENFLKAALPKLCGKEFSDRESVRNYLNLINASQSARFALEEALLLLLAHNNIPELFQILDLGFRPSIKVNAALGFLNPEEYISRTTALIQAGYSTIKIKIGRDDFSEDYRIIQNIREHFGNKINLRADVNGKWNIAEAIRNIQRLDEMKLEYIEQPVNTADEFLELKKKVKTPLAADESIRNLRDAHEFINAYAADYIILKPMLTGGTIPAIDIINEAMNANIKLVLSSSFETILGAIPSLCLASNMDIIHGFGVFGNFENDPFNASMLLKDGTLNLNDLDLQKIYSIIDKNISFSNA